MRGFVIVGLSVIFVAPSVTLAAQLPPAPEPLLPDGTLAIELSVLEPRGDFRPGSSVPVGYGLRGALGWGPRHAFDIGLAYRSITRDAKEYGDSLEVKNMLRTLALSVRYAIPLRHARPYLGASAGAGYVGTETILERCCDENGGPERSLEGIALARIIPIASIGLGVTIDLSRMTGSSPSTLSANLGVEAHRGGRVRYQVDGDGDVHKTGIRYRVYTLGVSVRTR